MLRATFDSPVGPLTATTRDGVLVGLAFDGSGGTDDLPEVAEALRRYFAGDLAAFDGLAIDPLGGTPFQREVWAALREIPAGRTASYADIAERIGRPRAVRAVGAANGQNPVAIAIPCHRVIGRDGTLTGYGGGLPRKEWLLRHEGVLPTGLPW
jgi:methylated-DNA-[protein]-cysteine S-methyltransferase